MEEAEEAEDGMVRVAADAAQPAALGTNWRCSLIRGCERLRRGAIPVAGLWAERQASRGRPTFPKLAPIPTPARRGARRGGRSR